MHAPDIIKTISQSSLASDSSSACPSESDMKKSTADFEFGEILGEGSFSTVVLAIKQSNGKKYAVKILDKSHIVKERKIKYVGIEKDALHKLRHKLIVRLYYTFQDSTSLYFVLEYCSQGDLLSLIKKCGRFHLEASQFYCAEILLAIEFIHSNHIIHRDIKPENILLTAHNHVKVTDFGSAIILDGKSPNVSLHTRKSSFVGTAEYCSPELLNEQLTLFQSDIWAWGCILFQMLVGLYWLSQFRPPFHASNEYQVFQKVSKLNYTVPVEIRTDAKSLIAAVLRLKPDDRPTIAEIKSSDFLESVSFESLVDSNAPEINYQPPLQVRDPDPCPGEDSPTTDKSSNSSVSINEVDSWLPDLRDLGIELNEIIYSTIVKEKKFLRFVATGLLFTKKYLYFYDIRKKHITDTLAVPDLTVETKSNLLVFRSGTKVIKAQSIWQKSANGSKFYRIAQRESVDRKFLTLKMPDYENIDSFQRRSSRLQEFIDRIVEIIKSFLAYFNSREILLNSRKLVVEKQIGEGGFSFVYLVRDKYSGTKFALKRINTQLEEHATSLANEIAAHKLVDSPYVLPLIDSKIIKINGKVSEGLLLLPFHPNGTIQNLIDKEGQLSISTICKIGSNICDGLAAFHHLQPPMAFRDLKPANVLITEEGNSVIMDLGSVSKARVSIKSRKEGMALQEHCCITCTAPYRAPELFDPPSDSLITEASDIWYTSYLSRSLGCLLYACAYKESPFDGSNTAVISGKIAFPTESDQYGQPFRRMLYAILQVNPDARPSLPQIKIMLRNLSQF